MQNYATVEEKALEWGVTTRHVQFLCRKGAIEGVVKRVGAWFIPADSPTPVKNTKAADHSLRFVGTKKRIFDSAIKMFMMNGFERVNVKDIADCAGIKQSTVYNHFKSKQEILDTIYDYYCYYYLENRTSVEELEKVIENGSLIDLIERINYGFKDEYKQRLSDISKIIFQRNTIDDRAREIARSLTIEEGMSFTEDIFIKAVERGRLAPFDTRLLALLINSVRVYMFYNWIVNPSPDNIQKLEMDERRLYEHATMLLTDLHISA